jgi:hypothetical protein
VYICEEVPPCGQECNYCKRWNRQEADEVDEVAAVDGGEAGEADEEATTPLPQQLPRPGTAAPLPNHEEAVAVLHLPEAAGGIAFIYFPFRFISVFEIWIN